MANLSVPVPHLVNVHHLDGLHLFSDFVTELEEKAILQRTSVPAPGHATPARMAVIGQERQRVERYGKEVYVTGNISSTVPPYLHELCERVYARGLLATLPDSVSVNEYRAGQGLIHHVDNVDAGEEIAILGLESDATMEMRPHAVDVPELAPLRDPIRFAFGRRSLVVMRGIARWNYSHAILPVTTRRISVVFRCATR